jgi:A/G-specific adenine glycosylase
MSSHSNGISAKLIDWYQQNQRDLPWRNTADPYKIWISEIILQQTRVNQGMDYYYRFVERFPDVASLAKAHEDEVLKYWQGLGYYSRARNLHKAAQQIMEKHRGRFPDNFQDVLALSGIGTYTASAICSFAYHQPYAVVDGNVYRVLARLFNISLPIDSTQGIKQFQILADEVLDRQNPGTHNQAIMEFGALQCVPVNPDCENCTLKFQCLAFATKNVSQLPVKSLKIKTKTLHFNYLNIQYQDYCFIRQRKEGNIWKNLFEFPLIEDDCLLNQVELINHAHFREIFKDIDDVYIRSVSKPVKHILTHRKIMSQVINIEVKSLNEALKSYQMIRRDELDRFAVSRLMEIFIEDHLT